MVIRNCNTTAFPFERVTKNPAKARTTSVCSSDPMTMNKPMKKKIISKKRNVKKKVAKKRKLKINGAVQWGEAFEGLRREAHEFNMIKPHVSGDPFTTAGKKNVFTIPLIRKLTGKGVVGMDFAFGNEETSSHYDVQISGPDDVDKNDILDAMRYYHTQIDASDKDPFKISKSADPALRKDGVAPAHYSKGEFTPWEVIKDWKLEYFTGNAMKYICRHEHKGKPVEDIQKAIDCLVEYKSILEKRTTK